MEDGSVKKRLRSSNQHASLLSQSSSSKRKCIKQKKPGNPEICEGIRMDLPEDERLALLLQSCLEYTLQKLQRTLETREDFSLDAFQTYVSGISNDVKRVIETMKLDGTLKKCTEKPDGVLPTPETEVMMKQLKGDIVRLNAECKAWDRLLDVYQQKANAATDLGKVAVAGETLEPVMMMENSQIDVIKTKPDYRCYFDEDVTILQNMECIMDQLQLTMNLITRARQEWDSSLQTISEQLASRTFKGLEECPLQKFLTVMKE
ncbi:kinetochore-associated protein DSN1 homolog isoform X2 [Scyliorhinus canicula]|uniref:kinetochore-associated protein DSN1 homolog isoform X2 n=1 Tax=Scyliorhinus canicula TaxID=7830 RepID=UPI0018F5854E|nr:kinetochore-associated protein DSN1 homolog isoform X2 [Scyliorhinus canicula]